MTEVENKDSVIEQVAPAETNDHVEQTVVNPKVTEAVETAAERDWKEIRRRKKELEETIRIQQELIENLKTHKPKEAPVVDEIDNISDEEFIPKGKVSKLVEKKARQIAEEQVNAILKKQEQSQYLDKLKRQYQDFSEVVTPEAVALLEEKEPELALAIASSNDPYKIGVQSYKYIKALGLSEQVPEKRRIKEAEKKMEENAKTVQSPQVYDKRPMAQAFKLTEAEKTKLYTEMMQYANMAGSVPEL